MHGTIVPDGPLLVMYNETTDELGISADNFDLVAIATFLVFNRLEVDIDDYEEYSGGSSPLGKIGEDGFVNPKLGYIPNGTIMVTKDSDWVVIGQF